MKLKKVSAHIAFIYDGEKPYIFNMNRLNPTIKQLVDFKELFEKLFLDEIARLS